MEAVDDPIDSGVAKRLASATRPQALGRALPHTFTCSLDVAAKHIGSSRLDGLVNLMTCLMRGI